VMNNAREFDGKPLRAADHADVKLPDLPKPPEGEELPADRLAALTAWLKETLGDLVAEVKPSDRLVGSPALALNADKFQSPHLRRMMKAMARDGAESPLRVNLEINPRHAVIRRLDATREADAAKAKLVAEQILDNALISAGLLDDPTRMVARLHKLMETL
jgi:TNF receptor-associated protein 1